MAAMSGTQAEDLTEAPAAAKSRLVLAYHEIVRSSNDYFYSTTKPRLVEHFQLLRERGVGVEITFDDGHISHYTNAFPVLEAFGLKGTFFVTAGWTGNDPEYMEIGHLRELTERGHRVEAHGWSHRLFTLCSPRELYEETRHAKEVLEDRLGAAVEAISIPHGRWNDRVLDACARAGYKDIYTSDLNNGRDNWRGVNLIGRVMMTREMDRQVLENLITAPVVPQRLKQRVKWAARSVLGDRLYHSMWRFLASDTERQYAVVPSGRPTTVLHLISSEGFYGAESMLLNLARSLNASGCRAIIGVFQNSQNPHTELAERAQKEGLPVDVVPCKGQLDRSAVRYLEELIDRQGVDVVHTHGCKANAYGSVAGRRLRVPLVATYHMAWPWPDRSVRLYGYHFLDRLVLQRFQKIATVSEAVAKSLTHAGLSRRKITTIANGINERPFAAVARNAAASDDYRMVVGLVGRLTPVKGHRYLIEAAPAILAEFPEVMFQFIGDGPERDNLEQMVRAGGLEGRIVFAGRKTNMPAVYASLAIVVLPSVSEGMPMTIIEALAAGRPVVASRVGAIPTLIRHGETGLLVEPRDASALGDAIRQLLRDKAQRLQFGQQGQKQVHEQFSVENMAGRYRAIYDEVLECESKA